MFELIVNAVKIALSKETRDGTNALIDALVRSPEWKKSICICEAKIPAGEVERSHLFLDILTEKLSALEYGRDALTAFRTASREMITNAIEHGCEGDPKKRIGIIVELSPTYVAVTVENPKSAPVHLHDWAHTGFLRLVSSNMETRGRGLQLIGRLADMVQQVDSYGIKMVIYRNRVVIAHQVLDDENIVGIIGGHSNPSLLRRLVHYLEQKSFSRVVLCLDPDEFELILKRLAPLTDVPDIPAESKIERRCFGWDDLESSLTHYITSHFERTGTTFRLVMRDSPYIELMKNGTAFTKISEAIASLKRFATPHV